MMTLVGRRVSRPWLPAPDRRAGIRHINTDAESLPVLAWPVCWELLSESDTGWLLPSDDGCPGSAAADMDDECEDDPYLMEAA